MLEPFCAILVSASSPAQVATLWSIRHTNLQRLLGYCWEKRGTAADLASSATAAAAPAATAATAAAVAAAAAGAGAGADGAKNFRADASAAAAGHAMEQAEEQVLVFEWVPGGNLHSRLVADGCAPLSVWQCLDVTAGVLRGLKHIQSHGVVHGRIHPRNILLDSALEVNCLPLKEHLVFN
ncbi:unnamed protein product [Closterium sp. Naga37s-1]|nr:unnamed protein product [Closterium sp. Naga37s-1]